MTDAVNANGTGPLQAESAAPSELSGLNARTARRQKLLLGSLGALALLGGSWFILGGDDKAKTDDPNAAQTIDTAGLVNRDLSQREFVATYGNRLDAVTREQKALKDGSIPRTEIEAQLAALKAENQAMRVDGQAAIDAISAENAELKTRLAAQPATTAPAVPPPAYGPQAGGYDARGRSPQPSAVSASGDPQGGMIPSPGEVKLMSFSSDKAASSGLRVGRPDAPPVVVEDSPDYLPPNSYAPARVIVGVDASAGVASQTDPLPVVLRITGPARSVMQNGKVLTTRIQGCVVNGAARGDLSSEKVYVKLARMTCDQPGGRVAVSDVKGFISFAGKSGVRGRVVSREGSLVSQALLAGIVGGFGRGFSANANSVFSGVTTNPDGSRSKLSAGDILGGGLGQGAADAADTVSKYLIERAEQYQPVVEMPTGIDVEIVFLDGVYVRNSQ
ncbi:MULTISPECIES: TraB/VirB10 family protein [Sphingomonadales]|uniref:Conjugal transfer protein TraB n=1 Tax=Sphingopyxis macrogoltabida TaxID=33050 RepID=A0AAC8YY94_SPHMC|nr:MULTISPECIES: TraB/VirB10 family protein [Sphingomonadaceae]ALJ12318.1 conjugal transfer protein TraB [Sphingopyxis macrogoltabida]AMU88485.1 conjugal transfer protein TraB [Sphingopyxis macrogoltabida]MBF5088869.1 conjugal transfer protein TraB [Novosphingobium sp. NBM11]